MDTISSGGEKGSGQERGDRSQERGGGDWEIEIVAVVGEADLFKGVDVDGKHYYQSFLMIVFIVQEKRENTRIQSAKTITELISIWDEMQQKAFISYKVAPKSINDTISDFKEQSLDDRKRFLIEILDKNQLYVNYSEIDDGDYQVSDNDKKLNRMFYEEG